MRSMRFVAGSFVLLLFGVLIAAPGMAMDPVDKADCRANWAELGFRNQGQCMRFLNTGGDSRDASDTSSPSATTTTTMGDGSFGDPTFESIDPTSQGCDPDNALFDDWPTCEVVVTVADNASPGPATDVETLVWQCNLGFGTPQPSLTEDGVVDDCVIFSWAGTRPDDVEDRLALGDAADGIHAPVLVLPTWYSYCTYWINRQFDDTGATLQWSGWLEVCFAVNEDGSVTYPLDPPT